MMMGMSCQAGMHKAEQCEHSNYKITWPVFGY